MKILSFIAVAFVAACTTPDISGEIRAFAGATRIVSDDAAKRIQAEIEAERTRLRNQAIAEGEIFYMPPNACLTNNLGPGNPVLNCFLIYETPKNSDIAKSERAAEIVSVLSEYVDTLIAVAGSDLPGEIETATGDLVASSSALAAQINNSQSNGWVFANADGLAGLSGFAARQQKTRILRQAVQGMQEPVRTSVDILVAYFVDTRSDPLVAVLDNIQVTYDRMKRNPGNPTLVAAYEKAIAAFPGAHAKSPIIRFQQILVTHDALVARLSGPASLDDVLELVGELNTLKSLF